MDDLISELYTELRGYLVTLIRNRLYAGCPEDYVYDCLNDVFEIALRKQFDSNFQRNPRGWLTIAAKNVVDNYNRKTVNRLNYYQFDCDMDRIPKEHDMIEDLAYQISLENNIFGQLKSYLSESDRQLYIMRFEKKMTPRAIAEELHVPINTVHTRLSRLKTRIIQFIYASVG